MWDCKTSKMSQSPLAALNAFGLFAAGYGTGRGSQPVSSAFCADYPDGIWLHLLTKLTILARVWAFALEGSEPPRSCAVGETARSSADFAEEKAHEFKGARRPGTTENTLGRPDFSLVVKNLVRDLLRAVADGGDVPIAQVHELATAVIDAPEFRVAQEILQGISPEFVAHKALRLAAMVLRANVTSPQNGRGPSLAWP